MANQDRPEIMLTNVRGAYPYLFEPRLSTFSDSAAKEKYELCVIFPKEAPFVKELRAEVKRLAQTRWQKRPSTFRDPMRDGDTDRPDRPEFAGQYFINLRSNFQPTVVDNKVKPIVEPDRVKGGDYFNVLVTGYVYAHQTGNSGVGFNLGNVQWLRSGDPIGGGPDATQQFKPWTEAEGADDEMSAMMGDDW